MSFLVDSFGVRLGGQRRRPLLPAPPTVNILWQDRLDSGNIFSDASDNSSGWHQASISGSASHELATSPVRSSPNSLKLSNSNIDGVSSPGVRMEVHKNIFNGPLNAVDNLPVTGYYSCWYWIDPTVTTNSNICQWKQQEDLGGGNASHRLTFWITAVPQAGGQRSFVIRTRINQTTGIWSSSLTDTRATTGALVNHSTWFHLETLYVWSDTQQGTVQTWVDGTQIWNLTGLYTQAVDMPFFQHHRQWTVNHYVGADEIGGDSHLFVDDAAIADGRVWGVWP